MGNKYQVCKHKRTGEKPAKAADKRNDYHANRLDERALERLGRMMPAETLDLKERDRKERAEGNSDTDQWAVDKSKRKDKEIIELKTVLPEIKIP